MPDDTPNVKSGVNGGIFKNIFCDFFMLGMLNILPILFLIPMFGLINQSFLVNWNERKYELVDWK